MDRLPWHDPQHFQTRTGGTSETHQYFIAYNVSFLISHLVQQLQAKQLVEEVKLHIWSSTFAFLL